MNEYIDYDDEPAGTAATEWLRARVGERIAKNLARARTPNLKHALWIGFRIGFLIGAKCRGRPTRRFSGAMRGAKNQRGIE